jgi:hypothetical protein
VRWVVFYALILKWVLLDQAWHLYQETDYITKYRMITFNNARRLQGNLFVRWLQGNLFVSTG